MQQQLQELGSGLLIKNFSTFPLPSLLLGVWTPPARRRRKVTEKGLSFSFLFWGRESVADTGSAEQSVLFPENKVLSPANPASATLAFPVGGSTEQILTLNTSHPSCTLCSSNCRWKTLPTVSHVCLFPSVAHSYLESPLVYNLFLHFYFHKCSGVLPVILDFSLSFSFNVISYTLQLCLTGVLCCSD